MNYKSILIGIVILFNILTVFSIDYECTGYQDLSGYGVNNTINVDDNCYGFTFIGENPNDEVTFNIDNINYQNQLLQIYDNTPKEIYEESSQYSIDFNFNNFDYVEFKYGSDYPLITSDYISRNKFVGTQSTDAKIYIENSVQSGQLYFISGSINNFKSVDLYFENFGSDGDMGEYRIFLNDIPTVDVHIDCGGGILNEKILIIEKNVGSINLYHDMIDDPMFDESRIKIISFAEFISRDINNVYLTNSEPMSVVDMESEISGGSDSVVDEEFNIGDIFTYDNIIETYNESKVPVSLYIFGLIIVMFVTFIVIGSEKMMVKTPKHMVKHIIIALVPALILLTLTKDGIATLITSMIISTAMALIYYKDYITKDKLISIVKYIIFIILLMIIFIIIYVRFII